MGGGDRTYADDPDRAIIESLAPAGWTTQAKALATAAKQYGLYVADIGSDFYVQGEPSAQWQEQTFRDLKGISMGDMEFVDTGAVTRDPRFSADSMAARW